MKKNFHVLLKTLGFVLLVILLTESTDLFAQSVSINSTGAVPDVSAMLDISSTNAGILIPRMTEAERDNIDLTGSPEGVLIYQTDGAVPGFYYYNGTDWQNLFGGNVPVVPGNTEYWLRPDSDPTYIYPEGNEMVKVYDSGQTYGIYYDGGLNQYGLYGRTTNVVDPTAAVVGFSDVSGNQTYGYLGFNGTYNSTIAGFGSLDGMAVYGMVDDSARAAGFFRTTNNASVAANIAYSDVWIAGYYYSDNNDNTYAARPTLYAQSSVNCDQSSVQNGIKAYSGMKYNSNDGYTVGGSFIAIGNQDQSGNNDGQDAIGVYGYSTTGDNKSSYGAYCVGDDTNYGKSSGIKSGIGILSQGSFTGSMSYGEIYGMNVSGNRYGLYVDGRQYTNDVITQLAKDGNSKRVATYVPTSASVDIIDRGTAELSGGKGFIKFNKKFSSIVSSKEPIIITVTPVGKTNGVYVQKVKSTEGFFIAENNNGKSNVKVNWIAIGTKEGYEIPENAEEVLDVNFDSNLRKVMNLEIKETDFVQKTMYWDGTNLKFKDVLKKGIKDLNKPIKLGKIKN